MKEKLIRSTSLLLLLAMVLGILPVFGSQQTILVYSTQSNSGQRDVVCTTLDGTSAEDYYIGEYAYDNLSELSADELYDALEELMTDTHKKLSSYNDCRDLAVKTDCEQGDGRVMLLYTSYSATRADYTAGDVNWNREHVWPKSLGGFETSQAGSDLHHIRPANGSVNTSRNNNKYGEVSGGSTTSCTIGGKTYVGGYRQGSTYFEPLDNVKGDVARICLYMYVRWAASYPKCGNITNVFQSVDVLLDWCELDPVDTWEMGRNEVVGAIQGNRNVFIDYPEYAWQLFGREVPEGMTTPSGEAAEGNQGTDPSCTHKNTEIKNASTATCGKAGNTGDTYCKDCGKKIKSGSTINATGNHTFSAWTTNADGSKTRTCSVCKKVETEGVVVPGTDVSISFADKANRTTYTTGQQVWKQNGITVTNDKSASTSNVGDYANPGRFYKSSKVTIAAPGMTKIVIDCSGLESKYVTPWSNSFTDSNATATVSGSTVTVTFKTPVDSFTWDTMSAQGRANKMTVTTSAGGGNTPVTPPDTTPVTPPDPPAVVPSTLAGQIAEANKLANDTYLPYESTITGKITDDPQASSYTAGQFKFTVSDGTHTLLCYFTPVTGGTPVKGDTVTVTGKLTAYNGAAQFDESATAVLNKDGGDTPVPPATTPVTPPETTPVTPPETTPITPPETTPVTPPETTPVTPPTQCSHTNVEYRDAVDPTCKEGFSGNVYCADCGEFLERGMTYPPISAHSYDSNTGRLICTVCGHDGGYENGGDAPDDDSDSSMIVWIITPSVAVLLIVGATVVVLLLKKRKR